MYNGVKEMMKVEMEMSAKAGCVMAGSHLKDISAKKILIQASYAKGITNRMIELTSEYTSAREQFGRPIGSFQAIQHMCADMLLQIESAKSIAYSSVRVDSDDIVELEMSSSMAKAYCSDVFNKVSGDNIQVHGGIGFTWEHPAHLYFKKAKSDSLIFGTAKSARNDVSRLLSL